jgi:hypothetical protein
LNTPVVEMNFFDDVARIATKRLRAEGYEVKSEESSEDVLQKYYNALKRRIEKKPRTVHIAKEFKCPPEHEAAFKAIRRKAEAGDDLVPHQSRKVVKVDYNDALLNDWDIHHLHLSTQPHPKNKRLLKGTPDVLFARVTAGDLYCLMIMGHKRWEERALIEVVHKNWPHTLTPIRGIRGESKKNVDSEEIKNLRKAGVNVAIAMDDGTVYGMLGGGYSTTGLNTQVVRATDQLRANCRLLEEQAHSLVKLYIETAIGEGQMPSLAYSFSLSDNNGTWCATDTRNKLSAPLLAPLIPSL